MSNLNLRSITKGRSAAFLSLLVMGGLGTASQAALPAFVPGNLVVFRVHSIAALNSAATAVFLDEYTWNGTTLTVRQSIPLSGLSAPNNSFTCTGSGTSDGALSRSQDRRYIIAGGYSSALGTTSVAKNATDPRVVARIGSDGVVDTTTLLGATAFSAGNCRWATSKDGSEFWVGGSLSGVWYATHGSGNTVTCITNTTGVSGSDSILNTRTGQIFNNQLVICQGINPASGTAHTWLDAYGSGLPTAAASVGAPTDMTGFPLLSTSSSLNVSEFAGVAVQAASASPDTIYLADGSGIEKYCQVSGTWTLAGSVGGSVAMGVTAIKVPGSTDVDVFYTSGTGAGNTIQHFLDNKGFNGSITGLTVSPVATATNGAGDVNVFRGLTVTPETATLAEVTSFYGKANGNNVNIAWTTQSEVDNAGFNLYRATSLNGEYIKVNTHLIPALGGLYAGATYSYNDIVTTGTTVYYRLEDIDTKGVSTFQVPIAVTAGATHTPAPVTPHPTPVNPRNGRTQVM
jgi:hypothetical protein